jgi:hypothetical protein
VKVFDVLSLTQQGVVPLTGMTNITVLGLLPIARTVTATEGMAFSGVVGSFTDADTHGFLGEYTATIDWGDNSPVTTGTISINGAGFDVTGSHTYAEEGQYPVKVSIFDIGEPPVVAQSMATIADAPLTAKGYFKLHVTGGVNAKNLELATFVDADPAGMAADYTIVVHWGDGTSNTSTDGTNTVVVTGTGPFTVIGSHTYAPFSIHTPKTITLTIEDSDEMQKVSDFVFDPPAPVHKPPRPGHSHPHHHPLAARESGLHA